MSASASTGSSDVAWFSSLRISSNSKTPVAMRRMLKRFSGPILSDDELPPTAPQPSVKAGTRFVVAPIPPSAPGVLTKRRETGFSVRIRE